MLKIRNYFAFTLLFLLSGCQMFSTIPVASATDVPHGIEEIEPTLNPEEVEPTAEDTAAPKPTATPIPLFVELSTANIADMHVAAESSVMQAYRLSWSLDSSRVAVLSTDGFSIFSAESGALLKSIVLGDPYRLMDASVERELIAVTTDQESVEFRSMDNGEIVSTLIPDELFLDGRFNTDGYNFLLSSGYDIAAKEWDIESGQLLKTVTGFETAAPVYHARYDDESTSLIWTARATVQVYDLVAGQFGKVLGHEDFVNATALAPNGRLLAATTLGTIDGEIMPIVRLWDAFGGQILADIPTGESIATSLHFSTDGTMLIMGGHSDITIWQVQDQLVLLKDSSTGGTIRDVKFSPDGKALAIVDESGSLKIMRVIAQ
ncbi:MAG: hypothetical protein JEZ00_01200 [Anaerolineaceae bacterium]|nr:hypothetical protein [Anaerolineaceae bacterium]